MKGNYPIVNVTTPDGLILHGFLAESENSDTILINIHGTGGNFYCEGYEEYFTESLTKQGTSVLFTNNRGNQVMEYWQRTGAALEIFEECLIDIDTWIEFIFKKGYKKIILQGHSLGSVKVVYYMEKGKYRDSIVGLSLLGFADPYGSQMKFIKTLNIDPMTEAKKLVAEGKEDMFLTSVWLSHDGVLPKSARSYVSSYSVDSELSKAFPLRDGKDLEYYRNIKVPIFGAIGQNDEWVKWVLGSVEIQSELLRTENSLSEIYVIQGCGHSFEGKQQELVDLFSDFINRRIKK